MSLTVMETPWKMGSICRQVLLFAIVATILSSHLGCDALTISTFFGAEDKARLKSLFLSTKALADLPSAHYAAFGSKLLGEKLPKPQDYCNVFKKVDQQNLESLFHAVSGSKLVENCQVPVTEATLQNALKEDSSVAQLYHAVLTLKALGSPVDSAKVTQLLQAALKKDDSVLNLGYAFHIASALGGNVSPFLERVEDAIVQADEVGGEILQFEGGLSITATIISGVYRLAEVGKQAPTVTKEQALKFTNYFLSRKNVQTVKGAALLYDVLKLLTENKFHVPVAVTVSGPSALTAASPTVVVKVTNVLGQPFGPLSVILSKAVRLVDDTAVLERKPFAPSKEDASLYVFNFMSSKPRRGFYKLNLNAVPIQTDARLLGNSDAEVEVKVMTQVEVVNLEIGTSDREQTSAPKMDKVQFQGKLANVIEADNHQKLVMKFSIKDRANSDLMLAHQAFVHLHHVETKREIVFLAEPDNTLIYRFDLDLHLKAKDLGYLSGKYSLSLIVGDAVVDNPFQWTLATLELSLPQNPNPPKEDAVNVHVPKQEIKHVFREQDKRPPAVLSNLFCGLVLAPLLLLLILWFKLGANISGFPLSLSAVLFHLGLAAIFGLFFCFWVNLNMFTTLKCLSGVGAITFISGHRLLSGITQKK
ncbi:dolichyl-diphosphooligosaccharide--protein glycosyltransferase subunit 2-like [Ornithodoros turicata]|uniref:dolichyl-diphosphooligosaccharide--protein glycosyltransferase subunit 2-like n=1 Tax=Ornithodoros turicata TaxID=34597 RepID=UPI0031397C94